MRRVALSFLAHPDDAEMACTGTLIRLKEAGWEVHIATVTGGDLGSVEADPEKSVATRIAEATRAAELIGATYHCIREPDGRVIYDRTALNKAIDLFRSIAPSLVIAHPPVDYHRDHEVSHQLARAASFIYAAPGASKLPLIDGSAVPHLYYINVNIRHSAIGHNADATTLIDVADQMAMREKMLLCHESQIKWLAMHHKNSQFEKGMIERARRHGEPYGLAAAESFIQHRVRPYPDNDILAELLGSAITGS